MTLEHNLKTLESETSVGCATCECWIATKDLVKHEGEEGQFCDICDDRLDLRDKWIEWSKIEKLKKELQNLFANRPRWVIKENSKAVDILRALAELQRWCDMMERKVLGLKK